MPPRPDSLSSTSLLLLGGLLASACSVAAPKPDSDEDPAGDSASDTGEDSASDTGEDTGRDDTGIDDPGDPSLQEFLLEWYADYDAGESTDYLLNPGTERTISYGGRTYTVVQDAHYGPHGARTTLDIILPEPGAAPAPAVLFIHGGGFRGKDKSNITERSEVVADYLSRGIAVASINYRFRADGLEDTVPEPNWDCVGAGTSSEGCRLDVIYRDGARAVQYLRYRSDDLPLDPTRVGAWGRSAGGQIATWVGVVPDLAVADHPDPVLRESTRLQAVGHTNSQATGPSFLWEELIELPTSTGECDLSDLEDPESDDYVQSLQATIPHLTTTPEGQDLVRVVDFLRLIDPSIPPLITSGPVPDLTCEQLLALPAEDLNGKLVHHPRHSEPIYARCLEQVGPDGCAIVTDVQDSFTGGAELDLSEEERHAADFISQRLLAIE